MSWAGAFGGVCAGTFLIGCYNATGALYRFAAADAVAGQNKPRAISLVLAGGIMGGLLGPESSKLTKDWLAVTYAGTYLSLVAFALAAIALQWRLVLPPSSSGGPTDGPMRSLGEIVRQPKFIVAVLAAALGYGVMNLLMVATPLAMQFCGHPFSAGVFVLEWHVVGMFAPGFFTGNLIKRHGVTRVLWAGVALNTLSAAINLSGTTVAHFWLGLFLLGVGWNFLFVGGTTLLTETYAPREKTRVQGVNDMLVFATMAVSSSSAGLLVNARGWEMVNYTALPAIGLIALALLWLRRQLGLARGTTMA
ncbi:MAG: MFS transporter [Casimicrobiaceae bacterium]